jgi:hypothetical protein
MQFAQHFHNDRTSSFMAIMITVGAHVYHDILDAGMRAVRARMVFYSPRIEAFSNNFPLASETSLMFNFRTVAMPLAG